MRAFSTKYLCTLVVPFAFVFSCFAPAVYADEGRVLFTFDSSTFNAEGISFDEAGRMFVANTGEGNIKVFDRCGNFLFSFGDGIIVHP